MDFPQKKRKAKRSSKYLNENLKIAREFSKKMLEEMNEYVRSIVLFGSNTKQTQKKNSDIDILIILDNVTHFVTPELREAYSIISQKLVSTISSKIHLTTINLSDFWDMNRRGDPIIINILRSGLPLFDRDLVEPVQYLLEIGKIRPTKESIYTYFSRSETLLKETKNYVFEAYLDLYYACVDCVHALLMSKKCTPPSPRDMPELFKKTFKDNKKLLTYTPLIEELFALSKKIENRESGLLTGKDFDKLKVKVEKMITDFKKIALSSKFLEEM